MLKKLWAILAIFILSYNSFAQRIISREDYIQTYSGLAVSEMLRSGVPASITLAQGCLESNNGNSMLSVKSNNHFGIKCKSTWNGKRVYHDDDRKNECFRHYNTVEDSYIDHSNFLMANPRYGSLFELDLLDYKGWARGLKKAGYATASHYADQLIKIIEEHKLYLFDQGIDKAQLAAVNRMRLQGENDGTALINPYLTRKVVLRNGLKSIVVKPGDTFEKLAQEFDLKTWEVYTYNDYSKNYRPKENEILYLEPKMRKADKKHLTHRFESDDTMHFIAQRYGIKLSPLYKRNRMKPGEKPQVGTIIYLRKKKPRN
ncbi:glucosaminidase domain-containing protein [Sunxiuqinia sp. A32]|uniref:glucosaminidase domain-containing protein n=1 Tax=Sunxiuqinia sp. A32 TaxID=3461496 RepID=UPI0040452B9A